MKDLKQQDATLEKARKYLEEAEDKIMFAPEELEQGKEKEQPAEQQYNFCPGCGKNFHRKI